MNTADGDGCSMTCTCEPFAEAEINDDYTVANVADGFCRLDGAVGASGDNDWYSFTLAQDETITVESVAGGADTCAPSGNIDTEIEVFDTDGTTSLVFNDDVSGNNYCSTASFTAPAAGTYFVRVSASNQFCAACTFDYGVSVEIE